MDIREEILAHSMAEHFRDFLRYRHMEWEKEIESVAVKALAEIQKILEENTPMGEVSDFMTIEKILEVFEKYNLSSGVCHDFG